MAEALRHPMAWLWSGTAVAVVGLLTVAGGPATFAGWSDSVRVEDNRVGAGVWAPDPPAACGPLSRYVEVVHGTPGPDELVGDGRPRIYMGLGGDDVLTSSKAPDCLVGGPGRDVLVGNPASILVGGPEDQHVWQPPASPSAPPGQADTRDQEDVPSGLRPDRPTRPTEPDPEPRPDRQEPRPGPQPGSTPGPEPLAPPPSAEPAATTSDPPPSPVDDEQD